MKNLIVGLGNPGSAYEETRHNMGFQVVKRWAAKQGLSFRRARHLVGEVASQADVTLLLPMTYMNSSGESVRLCVDYFKLPVENILVVCDDIALPFGEIRLRQGGSAGGHNGLKSVEAHLGTQAYSRLKVGVGDRDRGELADHVLGRFTAQELQELPEILEKASEVLDAWLTKFK